MGYANGRAGRLGTIGVLVNLAVGIVEDDLDAFTATRGDSSSVRFARRAGKVEGS